MILESGLVKSRILGSMSLKGDNEYLPQISLSFPNIFNLNTSILNFTNQSLTVSLANQTAKTFLAAPNGLSGTPSFRAIIASDIPILNQSTTGNAATATALQTARTLTIGNTGKTFNGTSNVSWSLAEISAQSILTNPITGTGTTNYLPKFTGSGTLGNSQIFDNGTNVGIGTTSPTYKLDVTGAFRATTSAIIATSIISAGDFNLQSGNSYSESNIYSRNNFNNDTLAFTAIQSTSYNNGKHCVLAVQSDGYNTIGTTDPQQILTSGLVQEESAPADSVNPVKWIKVFDINSGQHYFINLYQ